MWMFTSLFIIPVITIAAAQSCPANQIASDAQIIQYGEFPAGAQLPAVSAGFDSYQSNIFPQSFGIQ